MTKKTKQNAQRGFTVLELAIVMVVSSLLLVPLLKLAFTSVGGNREQQTEAAMEKAIDALIAYADDNDGCLPFAADFEGGLPNTDLAGLPLTDTGISKVNQRAGDLPWADLGLLADTRGGFFLDGDFLRIQYYVASPYADTDNGCSAGFRGQEWNPQVTYVGTNPAPIYVYDTADQETTNLASLYKITGTLAAGNHPANTGSGAAEVTALLSDDLLVVKRGPDINGTGVGEKDEISIQNVFVLLAVGDNRNAALDRRHMRDSTHALTGTGALWTLGVNNVDGVVFSMTHNISATDRLDDGDDTIRVVSFLEYKSRLKALGMTIQPICETPC